MEKVYRRFKADDEETISEFYGLPYVHVRFVVPAGEGYIGIFADVPEEAYRDITGRYRDTIERSAK